MRLREVLDLPANEMPDDCLKARVAKNVECERQISGDAEEIAWRGAVIDTGA